MNSTTTTSSVSSATGHATDVLPLGTTFALGDEITQEQTRFLDVHGYLHFKNVLSGDELSIIMRELDRIEKTLLASGTRKVFGVPLYRGARADGTPALFRMSFVSVLSDEIKRIVVNDRFKVLLPLVGANARIGHDEADGVVVNRYVNEPGPGRPQLGWHTDSLRDIFNGRMPQQMLNFGLHLTDCPKEQGGLRLIPGSHKQRFVDYLTFRGRPPFLSHHKDEREIAVETDAGDMTVHDGRLWHRVERSSYEGDASERRSMYMPLQTGPYVQKNENSKTPEYHYLSILQFGVRRVLQKMQFKLRGVN